MNQHALLMHTVMRYQHLDSPELARRRENLARCKREAREARQRRGSEFIRRRLNALRAFHQEGPDEQVGRSKVRAVGKALR